MKRKWTFDNLFLDLALKVPYIGKPVADYYREHNWFRKFSKYVATIFVTFWLVKGPMIYLLTDIIGLWYVISAFVAGAIVTIVGFLINHLLGVIEWEKP